MNCLVDCLKKKDKRKVIETDQNKIIKDRLRPKFVLKDKKNQINIDDRDSKERNKNNSIIRRQFMNLFKKNRVLAQYNTNRERSRNKNKIEPSPDKEKPHWEFKDKLRCLFCGGSSCKHEDWKNNKNTAIKGINCDYITEDLIASQRPSTVLVQEYDLIKRFKEEGEHPYCGPNRKLELRSGFTYDPEAFISEDINVKLSGWKDMSVPDSLNFVLETVKEMAITIKENKKKVLVHCHAGYGRTGVIIACYILFDTNMDTEEVVNLLRKRRPGTIQKKSQYSFCRRFKDYISRARKIFFVPKISIEQYMKNQKDVLFGEDFFKFEYIPKILFETFNKIIEFKNSRKYSKADIYGSLFFLDNWTEEQEETLNNIKKSINMNNWIPFKELEDIFILSQLFYDWLEDVVFNIINPEKIDVIFEDKGLAFLINKHLEKQGLFDIEERNNLAEKIKNELRTIEFETLICLANFAHELKPENSGDKISMNDFHNMMRRICIQILGFPSNSLISIQEIPNKQFNRFDNEKNIKTNLLQSNNKNLISINDKTNLTGNNVNQTQNISSNIRSNINTHNNLKEDLSYLDNNLNNLNRLNMFRKNISNNNLKHIPSNQKDGVQNTLNNEFFQIQDEILFYGDCLNDLIGFLALIIKLDFNQKNIDLPTRSQIISKKNFSPMTKRKSIDINILKKNSFVGLSRFAFNIIEKESNTQISKILKDKASIREKEKISFPENDIIDEYIESINKKPNDKSNYFSSDSFSEQSEKEGDNISNKKLNENFKQIFDLKQCNNEENEDQNYINYIKDNSVKKSSARVESGEKNKDFTVLQNKTAINNNLVDLTSNSFKMNRENVIFLKEVYKILHNYFNNCEKFNDNESMGPSFYLDVSKEANLFNSPENRNLKYINSPQKIEIDQKIKNLNNNFNVINNDNLKNDIKQNLKFNKNDKYGVDSESILINNKNTKNIKMEELLDLVKRNLTDIERNSLSHNIDNKNIIVNIDRNIINLEANNFFEQTKNKKINLSSFSNENNLEKKNTFFNNPNVYNEADEKRDRIENENTINYMNLFKKDETFKKHFYKYNSNEDKIDLNNREIKNQNIWKNNIKRYKSLNYIEEFNNSRNRCVKTNIGDEVNSAIKSKFHFNCFDNLKLNTTCDINANFDLPNKPNGPLKFSREEANLRSIKMEEKNKINNKSNHDRIKIFKSQKENLPILALIRNRAFNSENNKENLGVQSRGKKEYPTSKFV